MYDDLTAGALLDRMLDRYKYEFDKREGSLTWDEFSNVAIELRHLYIQLDWQWKQMFGDTADREALIRLAADRDIYPLPASPAIVMGQFNHPVDMGDRFNAGDLNYTVTSMIDPPEDLDGSMYYYLLKCETTGVIGNLIDWSLTPIRTIPGLISAKIVKIQIPGTDDEGTEAFRERYYETLKHNKYGFNIAEYQSQVKLIPGVGGVRTYPADPEAGYVRVLVISSEFKPASETLVNLVQETLDPVPKHQLGIGRAPIGHYVNVYSPATVEINVSFKLTLKADMVYEQVRSDVESAVESYLLDLRRGWEKAYDPVLRTQTGMIVRLAHIETRVLTIEGVEDVEDTKINGEAKNFNPPLDALPVLGGVTNA